MVSRPFARQSKKNGEEELDPEGTEEPPQFFSNDLRRVGLSDDADQPDDAIEPDDAVRPERMIVRQIPAAPLPEQAEAGWYPDPTEPGMMLYWDGFHMTGQAMHANPTVPPTGSEADRTSIVAASGNDQDAAPILPSSVQAGPTPGIPTATSLDLEDPRPGQPAATGVTWTAMRDMDEGKSEADAEESGAEPVDSSAGDPDQVDQAPGPELVSPEEPRGQEGVDEIRNWAEETERAVVRAQKTDTPEAWQEAAEVAAVVSQMAQIMQAAADTARVAAQTAKAASEAADASRVAEQKAADANQAVQETTKAAREAAEAADVAKRAAAEAKQTAEQASQVAPRLAEAAKAAAQAAADAEHQAQGLKEIVTKARTANTAAAWSEALGLSAARGNTDPGLRSAS